MRAMMISVLICAACSSNSLAPQPDEPDALGDASAGPVTVLDQDAATVCAGDGPCGTTSSGSVDDAGTRHGFAGSASDGGFCPAAEYWYFPVEISSYCGTVAQACQAICGAISCTVYVMPGNSALQQVFCPQDKGNPLAPH